MLAYPSDTTQKEFGVRRVMRTRAVSPAATYTRDESTCPTCIPPGRLRPRSQLDTSALSPYSATAKARCSTSWLRPPRNSWVDVKNAPDTMIEITTIPINAVSSAAPRRPPSSRGARAPSSCSTTASSLI
ncbi:MAG: hypothetical protein ABS52_18520 [Gemmatimonadetes bacterium SCN 70-22]|nr:MAG: hypothetical protein ABS52_18520 [Gemmatimonadetes bacterium SCN 70-22]